MNDLLYGRRDEISKLNFRDRAQPHHRRADRSGDDDALSKRRVENALFAEFVEQAVGYFENAAGKPDILAKDEDALVALHLLRESFIDCFQHVDRAGHFWLGSFFYYAQMWSASSDASG